MRFFVCALLISAAACGDGNNEQPRAVILNEFAADRVLVNARYADHNFKGPYVPGEVSERARVRSGLRFAYALTAHNWDGEGDAPLATIVRSLGQTEAVADKTVNIVFDEASSWGKCRGMDEEEYNLIDVTFFADYQVAAYSDVICADGLEASP